MGNEDKQILIIDDDPEFVGSMTELLSSEGYTIITEHNSDKGIATAREKKPDLIILDVMMDYNREGFDASKKIREDEALKETPIVMITGIVREMVLPFKFEPDEKNLPVNVFIEKPANPGKVLDAVHKLLS